MNDTSADWTQTCTRRFMAGFHIPDSDQLPEYADLVRRDLAAPLLSRFDPEAFVDTLKEAHVQAFWFYNKCHQGNCYYPSAVDGAHIHSGLRGRDLFGDVCAACLRHGIEPLCIYEFFDYRVMCDHPDWCCRLAVADHGAAFMGEEHGAPLADDRGVKTGRPCLCGPYTDFALAQALETVQRYPARCISTDGFARAAMQPSRRILDSIFPALRTLRRPTTCTTCAGTTAGMIGWRADSAGP